MFMDVISEYCQCQWPGTLAVFSKAEISHCSVGYIRPKTGYNNFKCQYCQNKNERGHMDAYELKHRTFVEFETYLKPLNQ